MEIGLIMNNINDHDYDNSLLTMFWKGAHHVKTWPYASKGHVESCLYMRLPLQHLYMMSFWIARNISIYAYCY